jgi:hypothetical protein
MPHPRPPFPDKEVVLDAKRSIPRLKLSPNLRRHVAYRPYAGDTPQRLDESRFGGVTGRI